MILQKKSDPANYVYDYEIGFAYQQKRNYPKAINFFEASTRYKVTDDQCYQMLGNCYDIAGDSVMAIQSYQKGLRKFPKSGRLYLELGVMEMARQNFMAAIKYWEKGIEVQPNFPSNYYRLAEVFSKTPHPIWAIFYGEIFLNLERNTSRTEAMSRLLYETYQKSITILSDTSARVDFTTSNINMDLASAKSFKIPFRIVYGIDFLTAMTGAILKKEKAINLSLLVSARTNFIKWWFEQKRDIEYPNPVLNYQRLVAENGHAEAYHYWLLSSGDEKGFQKWYDKNQERFRAFAAWFNENSYAADTTKPFIRFKD